jgi:hypothetical protein
MPRCEHGTAASVVDREGQVVHPARPSIEETVEERRPVP